MLVPRPARLAAASGLALALLSAALPSSAGPGPASPEPAALATGAGAPVAGNKQDRPNVVWILADDMRYDELRFLPAVRRHVIDRGVNFANASAGNALCCPARATLLTGQYTHNNKVVGNTRGTYGGWPYFRRYNDVDDILPTWMQQAGYRTWHAGKYLNQYFERAKQPGWDFFYAPIRGAYDPIDWTAAVNGELVEYRDRYQQRVMTRMVRRTIGRWQARNPDRPFFMYTQALAPHAMTKPGRGFVPPIPEPRYADTVDERQFEEPRSFAEKNVRDKPRWVRDLGRETEYGEQNVRARRVESLASVNDTVQAMARELRRTGDYANTVFVFMSDNGYLLGEHRIRGKNVVYAESQRVPLAVAGPGFREGVTVRRNVTLADVVATTLRAAGADPDYEPDGIALQRYDSRPLRGINRPIVLEGGQDLYGNPDVPVDGIGRYYTGVRWRHYVYAEYESGEREFYDLREDPHQLRNAYERGRDASRAQRAMQRWLARNKDCNGRDCNAPLLTNR